MNAWAVRPKRMEAALPAASGAALSFGGDSASLSIQRVPHRPARRGGWAYTLKLLALAGILGAGLADGYQRSQERERLQNHLNRLEAEVGSTYTVQPQPDGTYRVENRLPSIPADVIRRTLPAAARLPGGMGVVIQDAEGRVHLLTDAALVDGETVSITVDGRGTPVTARLVAKGNGSALLKLADAASWPARRISMQQLRDLTANPLQEGELVFVIGPDGSHGRRVEAGFIHREASGQPMVEYLGGCTPQMRGSPIFDAQGRLLGLQQEASDPPGRCTGTRIDAIKSWLAVQGLKMQAEATS